MISKWLVVPVFILFTVQAWAGEEPPVLKTEKDKVNYAIGVNIISNIRQQGVEIDMDLVIQGMKDAHSGGKLLLSDKEIRKATKVYQAAARNKQTKARMSLAEANRKEGEAFLAENRKKEGVLTLPSGLQYKILKAGEGKKPADADTVEYHYRSKFINGTEFDSSYRAGKPVVFKVSGMVLPGLSEALKLMPMGSKWQLFIPPQLAYGEKGAGRVGPGTTLIFEVELLSIK